MRFFALLMATLLLWACTAVRPVLMDWMLVDGDRNTARLTLAIMWNPQHDKPDIDVFQAQLQAAEKCRAWGFQNAEQIGDMETLCTRKSSGMLGLCIRREARLHFQCLNGPSGG